MGLIKPELINLAQHPKTNPVLLKEFFAKNMIKRGYLTIFCDKQLVRIIFCAPHLCCLFVSYEKSNMYIFLNYVGQVKA
jgi:hypothetical protein